MPLLHIPPEAEPDGPRVWPKVDPGDAKDLVWVGPDGTELRLTGAPYTSLAGRAGFGPVEPDVATERTMRGTALIRDIRETPRVMSVPLLISGGSPEEYLQSYRVLQRSLRHKDRGRLRAGELRVEMPGGSRRSIACYYYGGLEPVESELDDMMWARQEHPDLEFYAPDPAFVGPQISQAWRIVVAAAAFYPIYPLRVIPSQLGGSATVDNPGDLNAYPVWEITGPGTPTITNTDTGESFAFDTELSPGQVVTVDTRPPDIAPDTGLTAADGSDTDFWPNFDGLPSLFALPSGETSLQIDMVSATEDSSVQLNFEPRYLAGW